MFGVVIFGTVFAICNAITCEPIICESFKQESLNCSGSVIKGGGYCACTDVCARVEGEPCRAVVVFGPPSSIGYCDKGLKCKAHENVGLFDPMKSGTCVKDTSTKRFTRTKCEQMRMAALMTMVVYAQKWTANCDADGNFLPMQCDFSGHCFCVNSEGVIQGERVPGKITCPAI